MVFDVARVRGLYVSLSDGWTYLNAQENAQVPEKVSTGVAMAFRTAASIAMLEPATGSHSKSQLVGQQLGISQVEAARRAIADLVGATPERVVLGPNKQMLMRSLADALRPILRPNTSVVLCRSDEPTTTQHFQNFDASVMWAEPDLGTGELPAWQFSRLVSGSTRLVVLPAAHRLVGTITPVSEISDTVHSASRAWVLVDGHHRCGMRPSWRAPNRRLGVPRHHHVPASRGRQSPRTSRFRPKTRTRCFADWFAWGSGPRY